jgi:hypothetical protein
MIVPEGAKREILSSRALSRDLYCYAEHDLMGSTTSDVGLPWTPYALIAGTIPIEEVNELRISRGMTGVFTMVSEYFGIEGDFSVRFSL